MPRIDPSQLDLKEKLVEVRRVSKTVAGGRRLSFSAVVVVGDGQGYVGAGLGKATEIPEAIRKAIEDGKKSLIRVPLNGTTITHEVVGRFGAGKVLLKPAAPGTGVIAGGAVRAVLEMAGVRDVLSKCIGSTTASNAVSAALEGLRSLRSPDEVAKARGKSVEAVLN